MGYTLATKISSYRPVRLPPRSEALPISIQLWQRRRGWQDCARHESLANGRAHVQVLRRYGATVRLVWAPTPHGEMLLDNDHNSTLFAEIHP
jgi:hypothetical protein